MKEVIARVFKRIALLTVIIFVCEFIVQIIAPLTFNLIFIGRMNAEMSSYIMYEVYKRARPIISAVYVVIALLVFRKEIKLVWRKYGKIC